MEPTLRIQFAYLNIGILGLGLVKLSVASLYWHLFSLVALRRFLIFWITLMVAWTGVHRCCIRCMWDALHGALYNLQ